MIRRESQGLKSVKAAEYLNIKVLFRSENVVFVFQKVPISAIYKVLTKVSAACLQGNSVAFCSVETRRHY